MYGNVRHVLHVLHTYCKVVCSLQEKLALYGFLMDSKLSLEQTDYISTQTNIRDSMR